MLLQLLSIFHQIVLPMLLLIAVGFAIQRRLGLDMPTLVRLNFYFVVPAIIYCSVVTSKLRWSEVATVFAFHATLIAVLVGITLVLWRLRRLPRDQRNTALMSVMFYNSGNYGLPLQDMAFRPMGLGADAAALQVFVMILQNFTSFTLGIVLAATGHGRSDWRQTLRNILSFPPIWALIAALLTVAIRRHLDAGDTDVTPWVAPVWEALTRIRDSFVAVALATLGAQLAVVKPRGVERSPVAMMVVLRLVAAPLLAMLLIHLAGLQGFIAQVLLISAATPTAVNAMLLCLQFNNHPDFIARCVFFSTVLSPVTVTLVIYLAQHG